MGETRKIKDNHISSKVFLEEIGFNQIFLKNYPSDLIMEGYLDGYPDFLLRIVFEKNYPIDYPKFYLVKKDFFMIKPHVEKMIDVDLGEKLCLTKDSENYFAKIPNKLLNDLINKCRFLFKSFTDSSFDNSHIIDFYNEFESYWPGEYRILHAIDEFPQNQGTLILHSLNDMLLLTDLDFNIDLFCKKTDSILNKKDIIPYIDLSKEFKPLFPKKVKQFIDILKNGNQWNYVKSIINKHKSPFIIFSFLDRNDTRLYAGINISKILNTDFSRLSGFRKNKQYSSSFKLESRISLGSNVDGIRLSGLTKKRIFTRSGNNMAEELSRKEKTVCFIGCGSLGASLIYKLAKSGLTNIIVIDNDNLSVDNIGRHLLGFEHISNNKALALEKFINKQLPMVNIKGYDCLAQDQLNIIQKCDLIVSTTGSDGIVIEEYLLNEVNNCKIPTLISCWFEAHAAIGHLIVCNENTDSNIFRDVNILDSEYSKSLKVEDAGCQSEFMPYSYSDAEYLTSRFSKLLMQYLINPTSINKINSIIGDIDGHIINDKNKGIKSYEYLSYNK